MSKCYVINLAAPHFQREFKLALLLPPCHPATPGLRGIYTPLIAYIVVGLTVQRRQHMRDNPKMKLGGK